MIFKNLPIGHIYKKDNIREEPEDELGDLEESLDQFDMIQPILVRPVGKKYEIVSGHRRYAAAKLHGDIFIPCIIRDDISDADRIYIQLVENTHRKQLSAYELVDTFNRMKAQTPGLTNAGIAKKIGRPVCWVANQYVAVKLIEKSAGVLGDEAKALTDGQIRARYQKTLLVGRNEKFTIKHKGNLIYLKCTSADNRDEVIGLLKKKYQIEEGRTE